MDQDAFTAVDAYLVEALIDRDEILDQALSDARAAGLPMINVAPNQGKLLAILAELVGARRILEIGTLAGYSAIWMARALPPDGQLVTLEYEPKHAEVARRNIARAGLAERIEIRVGAALESLPHVRGPFDLVFIDADKPSNPDYFEWALKLSRPGGLIVVDNVVRGGGVANPKGDASARGTRRMFEIIAAEPRVTATAVQTVGSKGWDGFCLVRVLR
ncbi:MAG TPA: O-methyltransferase [Phenylobacterium sp.]|uniref:O-methyltransferase n=1 Tax=Phenylobacterium sp. TaxID=1871053 RepID=UPI002CFB47C8|nr:O-methyltransferase [Phenylobacterium sp.]HSV02248.1 O-methyltransferase [Phenylobacterium sp.]